MTTAKTAFIQLEDGRMVEITDILKILYDGVVGSLDWGSGWWDGEDAAAVGWIGLMFGWAEADRAEQHAKDIRAFDRFRQKLDVALPPVETPKPAFWLPP